MAYPAKKNTEFNLYFAMYDSNSDYMTGAGSWAITISKDGGTFGAADNTPSELATDSGVYKLVLTATEMNADVVIVKIVASGAKCPPAIIYTSSTDFSGLSTDIGTVDTAVGTMNTAVTDVAADVATVKKLTSAGL